MQQLNGNLSFTTALEEVESAFATAADAVGVRAAVRMAHEERSDEDMARWADDGGANLD